LYQWTVGLFGQDLTNLKAACAISTTCAASNPLKNFDGWAIGGLRTGTSRTLTEYISATQKWVDISDGFCLSLDNTCVLVTVS
jgi:hypothetical protein